MIAGIELTFGGVIHNGNLTYTIYMFNFQGKTYLRSYYDTWGEKVKVGEEEILLYFITANEAIQRMMKSIRHVATHVTL